MLLKKSLIVTTFTIPFFLCNIYNLNATSFLPIQIHYYDIEPYTYTVNGTAQGMAATHFKELATLASNCFNDSDVPFVEFTKQYSDSFEFNENLIAHFKTNTTHNVSMSTMWFPILQDFHITDPMFQHNYYYMDLVHCDSIAVITKRRNINMIFKLVYSLFYLAQVLFTLLLGAVTFGFIIWLVEHFKNSEFPKSFLFGTLTGIWLSFVTMSSVGYGDVAPRNVIGRFFSVIWMLLGLIITATITGVASNIMANTDYLYLTRRNIAALDNSYEAAYIEKSFGSIIHGQNSHEEIVQAVETGEVPFGVMNSDVAAYMQDTWGEGVLDDDAVLVFHKIDVEIPIKIGFHFQYELEALKWCLLPYEKRAKKYVNFKHKRKLQVTKLYQTPMKNYIEGKNLRFLIALGGTIVLFFLFDLLVLAIRKYRARKKRLESGEEMAEENHVKMVTVREKELLNIKEQMVIIERLVESTMKTQNASE